MVSDKRDMIVTCDMPKDSITESNGHEYILRSEVDKLVKALEYFVKRCQEGSIRSKKTYEYYGETLAIFRAKYPKELE